MNPLHPAIAFLRRHRWQARGTPLLWAAVATLLALALMGAARLGWYDRGVEYALVAMVLAVLVLGAWVVHARRLTPRKLASDLDNRWTLRARLESAVELSRDESTWAAAQRNDATQALAGRRPPGVLAWVAGASVLALVACFLLVEGSALAWRSIHMRATASGPAKAAAAPRDDVRASIEWRSPDAEKKASAIEEVPLTAMADSSTGFRSVSLEMIVNGDRELSQPLDPSVLGDAASPGAHELTPSLYLDELDVKPFDIVSYRLVAELNTPGAKRTVSSPQQLIEIRPPQRDASLGGQSSEMPALIFELKARQINLIKQNDALALLAGSARSDPTWLTENSRVAAEQDKLAARTNEVLAIARKTKPPPLVVSNLETAASEMKSASREIAANANDAAVKPQHHALALIVELEQFMGQALSGGGSAIDPIKDEQAFKLPPRSETPAGDLEQLAARQQKNNEQLANANPASGAADSLAKEQHSIADDAAKLGGGDTLDLDAKKALANASSAAADAARQLSLDDRAAALVPATAAQRALEAAVAAQEKAGRAATAATLDDIRRTLNAASRASAAERTEKLAAVRHTLRAAAEQQQKIGSAEAANELVRLAELIAGSPPAGKRGGPASTSAPNSRERAREVAAAAAQAQMNLSTHAAAVSRAVRQLNRVSRTGAVANSAAGATSDKFADLELASQDAQWLTPDSSTIVLAQNLEGRTDALLGTRPADQTVPADVIDAATKLAAAIERGRKDEPRDEIGRRFNPADVDPAYRASVENYFERLSREGRTAQRPAAK